MSWTLHAQPIRNPWADRALLTGGRALYLAQDFENKCKTLLRFTRLVTALEADPVARLEQLIETMPRDSLLQATLDKLARLLPEANEQADVLFRAREARNYIAHEALRFSIHDERAPGLQDSLSGLRRHVQMLAHGDNLVSTWLFHGYEQDSDQSTPWWLIEAYPSKLDAWVFEPVWDLVGAPPDA